MHPDGLGRPPDLLHASLDEASRPGRSSPSGTSPCSPRVAYTTTTRWPSSTALASVPAVVMHSSSGWAWKATRVGTPAVLARSRRPSERVLSPDRGPRQRSSVASPPMEVESAPARLRTLPTWLLNQAALAGPAHRRRRPGQRSAPTAPTTRCSPPSTSSGRQPGGLGPSVRHRPQRHGGADGGADRRRPGRAPTRPGRPAAQRRHHHRGGPPCGSTRSTPRSNGRPGTSCSARCRPRSGPSSWPLAEPGRPTAGTPASTGDPPRQAMAPASRSLARRSASTPASASTSSVCWPAWAGGRRISPGRAAEARRRAGLGDAGHLDEGAPVHVVRVLRRLGHARAPARSRRRCPP